jgi:hypothetical protein
MAAGVHHDQGPADAAVGKGFQRQGLLQFDLHTPDVIDLQLLCGLSRQRADIDALDHGADARMHPLVAMAQAVAAASLGGLGIQPSEGGFKGLRALQRAGRGQPIAARDIQFAVEHHTHRLARLGTCGVTAGPPQGQHAGPLAAGKDLHLVTGLHLSLSHAAPEDARRLARRVLPADKLHLSPPDEYSPLPPVEYSPV